ncbi:MAG: 5-(carboxyamino)imidazole ribonucleotide mutase [Endomicrobiia bacterium]|nr:5-(carboxyamino)imidazole ribonucleotide mutase [Endomicrobiaceae bacterium]MDD3922208.1 5-(carboxyamino)imidazole ribonucleotide mutase [Endomicrobiaceae bacterium]
MDKKIEVAVLIGSDSDLPIVSETLKLFEQFSVSYSVNVASAHRTPLFVRDSVKQAVSRGAKVFIAAAGMSAALPGVIASETILPVIGIPIDGKNLSGMDSLFSIVQMPPSIPVACVSIGKAGAINAAVLALQMLAISDKAIAKKLEKYKVNIAKTILEKDEKLNKIGYVKYIEGMKK